MQTNTTKQQSHLPIKIKPATTSQSQWSCLGHGRPHLTEINPASR